MRKAPSSFRPRVMVLGHYWEERFFKGVAEYAREAGWILDAALRHGSRIHNLPRPWLGHGIIANTQSQPELIDYIHGLNVPVVLSQEAKDIPHTPTVMHDEREVGRIAAEHFLTLGFERFHFVAPKAWLTAQRGIGFEDRLSITCKPCRKITLEELPRELPYLKSPAAILAINDTCALEVMDRLLRGGRRVPEEFALLGVDDDEILCTLSEVPLSSVNIDYEGRGRRCAELLDAMMRGKKVPSKRIFTPIRGVTERESTNTRAIPHPLAAEALRYLRENFRQQINLTDLQTALGHPLRGIQDIFKKHVGTTLAGELARLRGEAALQALKDPALKLHAVALMCGYTGPQHLSRSLLRETGCTPQAWRRKFK